MTGITGYGVYLPRLRLLRQGAAQAFGWLNPSLIGAKGRRTLAAWDEDAATMAVEACRDCIRGDGAAPRSDIRQLHFATVRQPFIEHPTTAIIARALDLRRDVHVIESGGSRRAGLGALGMALADGRDTLVAAAHIGRDRAASATGLREGDGAVAIRTGGDTVLARLIGHVAETVNFIDAFRGPGDNHAYRWEERWLRDQGYMKLVVPIIERLLREAAVTPDRIDHIILPTPFRGLAAKLAGAAGLPPDHVVDALDTDVGDTGPAHPLLLLAGALEQAEPGQLILVAGFAAGCEAMLFETTDAIAECRPRRGLRAMLADAREEENYLKYLVFRDLIDWDRGPAAERDDKTALSALYRHEERVLALQGFYCADTREVLFGPEAAFKAKLSNRRFETRSFADSCGRILSASSDYLTSTPSPPAVYGLVEFEEGGRLNVDFTDTSPDEAVLGTAIEMMFRIHATDRVRGFTRYGWKAAIARGSSPEAARKAD